MKEWGYYIDELRIERGLEHFHEKQPPPHGPPPPPPPFESGPPPSQPPPHGPPPPPAREILAPFVAKALVLRILKEKPAHGYEIAERISSILGRKIAKSRVYNLLNTLETQGLVYSKWELAEGKARRIYYITDEGESFLEEAKIRLKILKSVIDYIFS